MESLALALVFLLASVVIVPIFNRLQLGSVLGYLIVGILIGPAGFRLVWDPERVHSLAEFGVIFLMFVIGLELQPSRLWVLRRSVFGLGALQVSLSTLLGFMVGRAYELSPMNSLIIGICIAMSSTALVLQSLAERNQLATQHGRDAFAILLFQDIIVIPIMALLPLLAQQESGGQNHLDVTAASIALLVLILGGRFILRGVFKWVAVIKSRELFTAAALLVVVGAAALMHSVGLSMALGAFLAGVLLADSEFRHELEADIEPFKGLLLGLFFISTGMSANISMLFNRPDVILINVLALYFLKAVVVYVLHFFKKGSWTSTRKLAIYISQGGEFAFVLIGFALTLKLLNQEVSDFLTIIITVSMLGAPLLFTLEDKVFAKMFKDQKPAREYDKIEADGNHVVIAGFGRFGQIVARILALKKIPFTALEKNADHVDFVRRFGSKIYYGDASRLDLLEAAKLGSAKLFVLAIDDVESSLKTAEVVRKHFPKIPIFARARNRFHAYKLLDLGVFLMERETLQSSLKVAREVIVHLGTPNVEADRLIEFFKKYDEDILRRQHAVYQDEAQLIQTSKQAFKELENLFESDAKEVIT